MLFTTRPAQELLGHGNSPDNVVVLSKMLVEMMAAVVGRKTLARIARSKSMARAIDFDRSIDIFVSAMARRRRSSMVKKKLGKN